jgi:hypothetical protein
MSVVPTPDPAARAAPQHRPSRRSAMKAARPRRLEDGAPLALVAGAPRWAVYLLRSQGPAEFAPGEGMDVRPHPHIGLATVTYLFEGEIVHRDSLGSHQPIRAGDINWVTAGCGLVHSERTSPGLRQAAFKVDGLQLWVALPLADEETTPAFHHHPVHTLPSLERLGGRIRVLAGPPSAKCRRCEPSHRFSTSTSRCRLAARCQCGATTRSVPSPLAKALSTVADALRAIRCYTTSLSRTRRAARTVRNV